MTGRELEPPTAPPTFTAALPEAAPDKAPVRRPGDGLRELQQSRGNQAVQRAVTRARLIAGPEGRGYEDEADRLAHQAVSGAGGLEAVRSRLEHATGADLSGVRVHTDPRADALNRAHDSLALTTGDDIYFRGGQYAPDTRAGRELVAHELAHVAQQASMGPAVQLAKNGRRLKPAERGSLARIVDRVLEIIERVESAERLRKLGPLKSAESVEDDHVTTQFQRWQSIGEAATALNDPKGKIVVDDALSESMGALARGDTVHVRSAFLDLSDVSDSQLNRRATTLIHELSHTLITESDPVKRTILDYAYLSSDAFDFLPAQVHLDNADSYADIANDVIKEKARETSVPGALGTAPENRSTVRKKIIRENVPPVTQAFRVADFRLNRAWLRMNDYRQRLATVKLPYLGHGSILRSIEATDAGFGQRTIDKDLRRLGLRGKRSFWTGGLSTRARNAVEWLFSYIERIRSVLGDAAVELAANRSGVQLDQERNLIVIGRDFADLSPTEAAVRLIRAVVDGFDPHADSLPGVRKPLPAYPRGAGPTTGTVMELLETLTANERRTEGPVVRLLLDDPALAQPPESPVTDEQWARTDAALSASDARAAAATAEWVLLRATNHDDSVDNDLLNYLYGNTSLRIATMRPSPDRDRFLREMLGYFEKLEGLVPEKLITEFRRQKKTVEDAVGESSSSSKTS